MSDATDTQAFFRIAVSAATVFALPSAFCSVIALWRYVLDVPAGDPIFTLVYGSMIALGAVTLYLPLWAHIANILMVMAERQDTSRLSSRLQSMGTVAIPMALVLAGLTVLLGYYAVVTTDSRIGWICVYNAMWLAVFLHFSVRIRRHQARRL